jgi:hypothetical protein
MDYPENSQVPGFSRNLGVATELVRDVGVNPVDAV